MVAGGDSAANRQNRGAGRGQVAVIDGIAVNGGVIPRRYRSRGDHIIGQNATESVIQRHGFDPGHRPRGGAQMGQGVGRREEWAVLGETIVGQLARAHPVATLSRPWSSTIKAAIAATSLRSRQGTDKPASDWSLATARICRSWGCNRGLPRAGR